MVALYQEAPMLCAALLNGTQPAVPAGASLSRAVRALEAAGGEAIAVTHEDGRYAGLFGLSDLLARVVPRVALSGGIEANLRFLGEAPSALSSAFIALANEPVERWCDPNAPVLRTEAPAIDALRLFCRGVRAIPLLGAGQIWHGTLTSRDAIRVIAGDAG